MKVKRTFGAVNEQKTVTLYKKKAKFKTKKKLLTKNFVKEVYEVMLD